MKQFLHTLTVGLLILWIIQSAGTLVESIYILDLMNTSLDEKAAGLLFFFLPAILLPLYRFRKMFVWFCVAIILIGRGFLPALSTESQIVASGLVFVASVSLFVFILRDPFYFAFLKNRHQVLAHGLGLAILLSVLLRATGRGLDLSLLPEQTGSILSLVLASLFAILLIVNFYSYDQSKASAKTQQEPISSTPPTGESGITASKTVWPILGIMTTIILVWFSFSAPSAMARWNYASYFAVAVCISLVSAGWIIITILNPDFTGFLGSAGRISKNRLLIGNLIFLTALTDTLIIQRVEFPATIDALPVFQEAASVWTQIPLFITILMLPVLFINLQLFAAQLSQNLSTTKEPQHRFNTQGLLTGTLLSGLVIVILVFANIFTNVWGYVSPVSGYFRNLFWLPYFLAAAIILVASSQTKTSYTGHTANLALSFVSVLFCTVLFGLIVTTLWHTEKKPDAIQKPAADSFTVMTFNIQQANDKDAKKSYTRQLAVMKETAADVIALQESDSARISLNNNDYVRYYASELGYHSYYGPTPVDGTFGTAILSKHPIVKATTIFTFSDEDEIATTRIEINVNGTLVTIYNVHPAGSDAAMKHFSQTIIAEAKKDNLAIILGDFNARPSDETYQQFNQTFKNTWTNRPVFTEIKTKTEPIDHIFVSPDISILDAAYIPPEESASDHPAHWARLQW